MLTSTVENILRQIDELPPREQFRLADLLNERRNKQAPAAKPPRDQRLPDQPWPEAQAALYWLREHGHEVSRAMGGIGWRPPGSLRCKRGGGFGLLLKLRA